MNTPETAAGTLLSPPPCSAFFDREYLGKLIEPTEDERKLRALTTQYIERTEAYDRRVCTGPIVRGAIMPADGWEYSQINRNAKAVMSELMQEVRRLGFTERDFKRAIADMPNTEVAGCEPATHAQHNRANSHSAH